jgi:hypothetical protein
MPDPIRANTAEIERIMARRALTDEIIKLRSEA